MSPLIDCPAQNVSPEATYIRTTRSTLPVVFIYVCATLIFKDKEAIGLREGCEGGFLGRAGGWNGRRESDIILFQLKAFKFLKMVFKAELNKKQSGGPFSSAYLPCSSQLLT